MILKQLDIFDRAFAVGNTVEERITYKPIKSSKATFLSGTKKEVHQWFRLTPSFGPDLVDIILKRMEYKKGDVVFDPFCGACTTLIQCKLNGIESFGFEINPLLHFVGNTSINWNLDGTSASKYFDIILSKFCNEISNKKNNTLENLGLKIPPIYNVSCPEIGGQI